MNRTGAQPPENRDHDSATAFLEIEAFLEHRPGRREELLGRIREGRICVSRFLCNSLWGAQSVEGVLRTFYPARRMEREAGIPLEVAEHIGLPLLPWGMASLMAAVPHAERDYLAAGSLIALASRRDPEVPDRTRADRVRPELTCGVTVLPQSR